MHTQPTPTPCPSWCTQTPEDHQTEEGWVLHAAKLSVLGGVTVEPKVYMNLNREGDLSADEARALARALFKAADLIDGGQSFAAEVPAAMLEQLREPLPLEGHELDKLAADMIEDALPLARRVWAGVEDKLGARQ